MEITVAKLQAADKPLSEVITQSMPIGLSFQLSRNLRVMRPVLELAVEKTNEAYKKHGSPGEKEGSFSFNPEQLAALTPELEALGAEVLTLDITKIKLSALDAAGVKLSPVAFEQLDFMIDTEA